MYDDICTVLNRTDQIRRTKSIVYDQRQAMLICKRVNIRNITVRIAKRLYVNRSCVILNGCFHLIKIMNVNEAGCNSERRKRVRQQIVAASVYGLLCNKMTAVLPQGFQRICNRRRSGGKSQSRRSAFQSRHTPFQHILRGVCQSSVDIAGIGKAKTGRRMGRVFEYIGSSRVNRYCAGVSCRVRILLAYMEL